MKEEKCWAIFQTVIGNVSSWQMSTRKLTMEEIDRIDKIGAFTFDFTPLGLDFFVTHHVIVGCHFVYGTKKAAKQIEKQLNEKGAFFWDLVDDEEAVGEGGRSE